MSTDPGRGPMTPDTGAATPATAPTAPGTKLILRARGVTKRFGGLVAVRDIDLDIPRGAIVSLIGPNGAGKTTFFNVIAGIIDPTAGSDRVQGQAVIARPRGSGLESVFWSPRRGRRAGGARARARPRRSTTGWS